MPNLNNETGHGPLSKNPVMAGRFEARLWGVSDIVRLIEDGQMANGA